MKATGPRFEFRCRLRNLLLPVVQEKVRNEKDFVDSDHKRSRKTRCRALDVLALSFSLRAESSDLARPDHRPDWSSGFRRQSHTSGCGRVSQDGNRGQRWLVLLRRFASRRLHLAGLRAGPRAAGTSNGHRQARRPDAEFAVKGHCR